MIYDKIVPAKFIRRPNRFIAQVEIGGEEHTVHVKNTGRCKELLVPGCKCILTEGKSPERKTKYDLIGVYKENFGYINMDSMAPNTVVYEWLLKQNFDYIKPEYTYGNSRIDFYCEKGQEKYLIEVKGCTLEQNGVGYFPDAPTERGSKHLRELTAAAGEGYNCYIAFVIQMNGITEVKPNTETDPAFSVALATAKTHGVKALNLCCDVCETGLSVKEDMEYIVK